MTSSGATTLTNKSNAKFPLPDGYFPPVKLTPAEIDVYEQRVVIIMKNALAEYNLHEAMGIRPDYGSRWTTVGNVEHLTAIREIDPSRAVEASRIFGRVDGDYRNFIDFFYSDSAQQVFAVNQFMFGYAVDAAVLCNIHTKASNKSHKYLGMKWVCLQPSPLSRKRDMCFLEYLVYSKDLQGRDVGVRITLPLLLEECPPLPDKLKTRRIHQHTVTIVRPTNNSPDSSEIFMTCEVDVYKGPGFSSVTSFKKLMTTLSSMALFADSKRISMYGMLDRSSWAPKKARANCNVCNRKFSATRRRQHCRLCGEVACRRCMIVRAAPIANDSTPSNARTFQIIKTVFCKVCMGKVRDSGINNVKAADSQDEGVSDAESSGVYEDKSRSRSFDSEYHLTLIDGSSIASLSPATNSFLDASLTRQDMTDDGECDVMSPLQGIFFSSIDSEDHSETKTSVSSSVDEGLEIDVAEPDTRALFDLRHLRTMAGAERVVKEVEEENLRVMRESLAALDFKAVRLVVSPSNQNDDSGFEYSSSQSCILPLMEEIEDEDDDDIIEIFGESSEIVSSTRQIVSSPLDETLLNDGALEQVYFSSEGVNVSINQRLHEQEVLLKRLVMAANFSSGNHPRSVRAHQ
ncbi:FYVE finger containing protein [Plasmopara halstedii]|uniref:FYVE finger containing protein n=1 Tax=Plasmopara halstedii TaxID=4781 RepID=A0A0P1A958_PLAHL|nr:FYVE finger containing protein [Plasmopara halstedii]CEG36716.1 FYVE finger containing protein [Plasmopara halstedii]|eukprot:XP_024573085.1 FYVE finger containing protein [Plasmopara halstedii]